MFVGKWGEGKSSKQAVNLISKHDFVALLDLKWGEGKSWFGMEQWGEEYFLKVRFDRFL